MRTPSILIFCLSELGTIFLLASVISGKETFKEVIQQLSVNHDVYMSVQNKSRSITVSPLTTLNIEQ